MYVTHLKKMHGIQMNSYIEGQLDKFDCLHHNNDGKLISLIFWNQESGKLLFFFKVIWSKSSQL